MPSHLYLALRVLIAPRPANLQRKVFHQKAQAPINTATTAENAAAPDAKRILVVDDNAVNRRVAQKQAERLGYLVDTVEGGKDALTALACVHYWVVLMDCEMPDMNGYATTGEIRRREGSDRHTTIIAMTAHALEGARELCLEAGMNDYIAKPVTLESLSAVLADALC